MKLSDVIKKIQEEKSLTQTELAEKLGTVQQNIANMRLGRPIWQQHWELFLKLLPFCLELDLIDAAEIAKQLPHDARRVSQSAKATQSQIGGKQQKP